MFFICPQGITYNPCPEGSGGFHLQRLPDLSITLNKMAVLKFWLDVFGEWWAGEEGLVVLQSVSTFKKGTSPFSFQSNKLFSMFLRQQRAISKSLSDAGVNPNL